jgi:NAD+ synthase (glutamine-hydrolysing)
VLGIVPKTYLPNYGEFYEARQFNAGRQRARTEVRLLGADVPFGADLIFEAANLPLLKIAVEICEDVWVPIPPSSYAALAGATVLVNLSASNITIGKSEYRHRLVSLQSSRCLAAYLYSSAGLGESTTDLGWDGQALIYESGDLLAQSEALRQRLALHHRRRRPRARLARTRCARTRSAPRSRSTRRACRAFARCRSSCGSRPRSVRAAAQRRALSVRAGRHQPARRALHGGLQHPGPGAVATARGDRHPAAGDRDLGRARLDARAAGLREGDGPARLAAHQHPRLHDAGLRDQHAHARAGQAPDGGGALQRQEIDIRPSCQQMLADIGHPYARGEPVYDIAFENVQAGERTSHLFRLANFHDGLVVGTGDLSELALGWSTYGVGDHMSHYNVNASVPKTLIKHLVRWVAASGSVERGDDPVLDEILETQISPELVPGQGDDKPEQSSEAKVGPYELQDFHLYYVLRYGFAPSKVAFLAHTAWHDRSAGAWPDGPEGRPQPVQPRRDQGAPRNVRLPLLQDEPVQALVRAERAEGRIGGSLSPRGDWRAPSDSEATVWLAELAACRIGLGRGSAAQTRGAGRTARRDQRLAAEAGAIGEVVVLGEVPVVVPVVGAVAGLAADA